MSPIFVPTIFIAKCFVVRCNMNPVSCLTILFDSSVSHRKMSYNESRNDSFWSTSKPQNIVAKMSQIISSQNIDGFIMTFVIGLKKSIFTFLQFFTLSMNSNTYSYVLRPASKCKVFYSFLLNYYFSITSATTNAQILYHIIALVWDIFERMTWIYFCISIFISMKSGEILQSYWWPHFHIEMTN